MTGLIKQAQAYLDTVARGCALSCIMLRRNCIAFMKSSSFPSLRVEPELREAAESVLHEGETLSSLIETSVRELIQRRRIQEEFIARGLRSREDAQRTGIYHSAESVHSELQRRVDARRKSVLG